MPTPPPTAPLRRGRAASPTPIETRAVSRRGSSVAKLSVAIGASAAGARAYTATASQGLLFCGVGLTLLFGLAGWRLAHLRAYA